MNTFDIDLATPAYYEWPVNLVIGRAYRGGELPLWNPFQGAGTPLATQYNTRAFFPYQILQDILPVSLWDYFALGRLWVAGLFTFLFLRLWRVSQGSSVIGGLIYMLSGTFVWFINLEELTNAAMVAPLLLWAVEGVWQWQWQRATVATAVGSALVLLAGQPEVAVFMFLQAAAYALFRLFHTDPSDRTRRAAAGLLGVLLGAAMAAPLVLPFMEFAQRAQQIHRPGGTMGVQGPAVLLDAISILVPTFYERETTARVFPDNGRWDYLGGYLGVVPVYLSLLGLALALLQARSRWRGPLAFFSLFGLAVVLKNFGFPLVAWVGYLPLLDQAWSPRWAGPTWTLAFALSAAFGLEVLRDQARGVPLRLAVVRWWLSRQHPMGVSRDLALSLLFLAVSGIAWLTARLPPTPRDRVLDEVLESPYVGTSVATGAVVAVVVFLLSVSLTRLHLRGRISPSPFVLLSLLELWFVIPWGYAPETLSLKILPLLAGVAAILALAHGREKWATTASLGTAALFLAIEMTADRGPPLRFEPVSPATYVEFLQQQGGFHRVFGGNGVLMPNFAGVAGLQDVRYINALTEAPYHHFRATYLHDVALGLSSSMLWFTGDPVLHGIGELLTVDFGEEFLANLRSYSILGVKYLMTPKQYHLPSISPSDSLGGDINSASVASSLTLVYDEDVKIYRNNGAFPRSFVAYEVERASSYVEAQELMSQGAFDFTGRVVLEEPLPAWYPRLDRSTIVADSPSSASIIEYGLNHVTIEVDAAREGVLVLTDVYAPGWKAWVDGGPAEVRRVDGLFRGVFLEAGHHAVVFRYFPDSFAWGIAAALSAMVVCLGLLASSKLRRLGSRSPVRRTL